MAPVPSFPSGMRCISSQVISTYPPILANRNPSSKSSSVRDIWVGWNVFTGMSDRLSASKICSRRRKPLPICATMIPGLPLTIPAVRTSLASRINSSVDMLGARWSESASFTPMISSTKTISFFTLPVMVGEGYP